MKKTASILFIFFCLLCSVTAQQKDTISTSIDEFWKIANDNAAYYEKKVQVKNKYSNEQIRQIAKKLFDALDSDPIGFENHIKNEFKKYEFNKDANSLPPAAKLKLIMDEIDSSFGKNYARTIRIPFFLRIKVLAVIDTLYHIDEINQDEPNVKVICQIEDVIKGRKIFNDGDIIELYYLPSWIESRLNIELGKSYFTAATIGQQLPYLIYNYFDSELMIYPIVQEQISVPSNVYGLGEKVIWKKFKTDFLHKFILKGN